MVGRAALGAEGPAGLLPHAVLGLRAEGATQKCTAKELTSTARTSRPSLSPTAGGLALDKAWKSLGGQFPPGGDRSRSNYCNLTAPVDGATSRAATQANWRYLVRQMSLLALGAWPPKEYL